MVGDSMKKLDVSIKDKNTLILNEDGNKGDEIDLLSLTKFDSSLIEKLIDEGKDRVYEEKLSQFKKNLLLENDKALSNLKNEYQEKLNDANNKLTLALKEKDNALNLQKANIEKEYQEKFIDLNNKINSLTKDKTSALELQKANLEKDYQERINDLNNKISAFELEKKSSIETLKHEQAMILEKERSIKLQEIKELENKYNSLLSETNTKIENEKLKVINEYSQKFNDLNNTITLLKQQNELSLKEKEFEDNNKLQKLKEEYENKLKESEERYNLLSKQKSSMNVKQIGEDLEIWCDNAVKEHLQFGLDNATWDKDNKVIVGEDEKGTKADYVFRIYSNNEHTEELASVCLDMKDENPDSKNKQTNEHYYKALDTNRNKKNCKYALLVSTLEADKPNALPIWRVKEYPDMYVVRPAYLISFLSMLNSLTLKFKTLLNDTEKERLELISIHEFEEKFNDLKNTYLDKPLESLESSIEGIRKGSEGIRKLSDKIDEECDKIARNYLNQIESKLSKFDEGIAKAYRKYDKSSK